LFRTDPIATSTLGGDMPDLVPLRAPSACVGGDAGPRFDSWIAGQRSMGSTTVQGTTHQELAEMAGTFFDREESYVMTFTT
jgi:hypothetical protein